MVVSILLHVFGLLGVCASARTEAETSPEKCTSKTFSKTITGGEFTILSIDARPQYNFTSIPGGPLLPALNDLEFCQVQVFLTHGAHYEAESGHKGAEDKVLVELWLPLKAEEWNGRFQATGGAGFATGMFGAQLGVAVSQGWAAAFTDGGHDSDLSKIPDASWALYDSDMGKGKDNTNRGRSIRWDLMHNFASRSAVDQIIVGKSITEQYYGTPPRWSYWNGCSTGGRQGYAIAQRYPDLLDGILANAPAIGLANLVTAKFVPQLLMKEHNTYLSNCELEYFQAKAIEECDMLDGVRDGMLQDPSACNFHAVSLVRDKIVCDGQKVTISTKMALIVQAIHDGPQDEFGANLFPGLDWGLKFSSLANIAISKDGVRSQNPFPICAGWLKDLVLRSNVKDLSDLRLDSYTSLWVRALREFGPLLNTDNPDLSKLKNSRTKLLTWHGLNDELIPSENTLSYRRQVENVMGGAQEVDNYYRVFLAPGVEHCGGGIGPQPKMAMDSLIDWVENGTPPETLAADKIDQEGDLVTQEICAWPGKPKYMGVSSHKRASSWSCVGGTERESESTYNANEGKTQYASMRLPQQPIRGGPDGDSNHAGKILQGLKGRLEGLGLGLRAT